MRSKNTASCCALWLAFWTTPSGAFVPHAGSSLAHSALRMAGFPPPMGGPPGPGAGGGGGAPPPPPPGRRPYGASDVPNAGDTASQPRQGEVRGTDPGAQARGLGALASGVRTPMDRYGRERPPRRPDDYGSSRPGGVRDGGFSPNGGGRPNNLRYEERDYGEYVTNLRSSMGGGGVPNETGYRDLEEEVARLQKENSLLKRSCRDLMNNLNDLSNLLFDVDEDLKKVAKAFPEEEEMESLEWLLRR